jgi:hypothetical protein
MSSSTGSVPVCKYDSKEMRSARMSNIFMILCDETSSSEYVMDEVLLQIMRLVREYADYYINEKQLSDSIKCSIIECIGTDGITYSLTQAETIKNDILNCILDPETDTGAYLDSESDSELDSESDIVPMCNGDSKKMRALRADKIYEILYNETSGTESDMDHVLSEIMKSVKEYANGKIDEKSLGNSIETSAYDRLGYHWSQGESIRNNILKCIIE